MTIDPTETTPAQRVWAQIKALGRFWAKFVGATVLVSLVFGPFAPLAMVAILLTVGMPILMLILWGRSLDEELGWTDLDEGPW